MRCCVARSCKSVLLRSENVVSSKVHFSPDVSSEECNLGESPEDMWLAEIGELFNLVTMWRKDRS